MPDEDSLRVCKLDREAFEGDLASGLVTLLGARRGAGAGGAMLGRSLAGDAPESMSEDTVFGRAGCERLVGGAGGGAAFPAVSALGEGCGKMLEASECADDLLTTELLRLRPFGVLLCPCLRGIGGGGGGIAFAVADSIGSDGKALSVLPAVTIGSIEGNEVEAVVPSSSNATVCGPVVSEGASLLIASEASSSSDVLVSSLESSLPTTCVGL